MAGQVPTVMVSSTFYDLREVRHQLARMIEGELGYRALVSEFTSFPIEPSVSAIENCRRRVEQDVDILILIIGQRYGSVESLSGRSVTNIEYGAARAKGIPIYAFIEQRVLMLFGLWKDATLENRAALKTTVDNDKLFNFIESVRSTSWVNKFEYASDITNALRLQFAYLMMAGLSLQTKLHAHPDREILATLSPQSFRLVVDRSRYWEYFLFAQVLEDECSR